jgi:DNA repair protein RecO (recombination protein O)
MLHTTRGIVLHQIKYSETSIIVKIYTENFGLQSYIVRGARKKNAKIKAGHLQHLALVEMEVFHKGSKDLQYIRELKIIHPFQSITVDIRKSSMVVFMNEVIYKTIKEEESNPELFNFIFNAIQILDLAEEHISLIHILFLVHLTKFLGFYPKNNYSVLTPNFDLQEGEFSKTVGPATVIAVEPFSTYISQLCNASFEKLEKLEIRQSHKNDLLEIILNFYRLHLPGISEFKSHAVLKSVFSE